MSAFEAGEPSVPDQAETDGFIERLLAVIFCSLMSKIQDQIREKKFPKQQCQDSDSSSFACPIFCQKLMSDFVC
jgi:hypothetical protein